MPNEFVYQQQKAQEIEITRELYNKQQEEAWNVVNTFNETASVNNMKGSKKAKYDAMNIRFLIFAQVQQHQHAQKGCQDADDLSAIDLFFVEQ